MPYYCKKCGAVVTGKYCSCCGARATSDLADFRKEMKRRRRAFIDARHWNPDGRQPWYSILRLRAADCAWESAEETILRRHFISDDTFPAISDVVYSEIPEIESKAAALYNQITLAFQDILGLQL